jgi:serine/threonine-protein kinase HipA
MGRKRKSRVLDVYVGSSRVGFYRRAPDGATSFCYDSDWLSLDRAFPVSMSIPLSDRTWSGSNVSNFFEGLLPDDPAIRQTIARREHAQSAGTFDLLTAIGRDCVGALRFVPEGFEPGDPNAMVSRPISTDEIAARIAALGVAPLGMADNEPEFRISIAGVQEKTAFLNIDSTWHLPHGATPTSHIFKPALKDGPNGADFSDSPWNEWVCLEVCRALGLEAARAEVLDFDGKPVLVVERFDRLWRNDVLYRLPQEDICQALGVPPTRKYQSDGGPGIADVLDFLNAAVSPHEDRRHFMTAHIVFWLLAAIDGHAKNFSIFLTPGGFRLTPLYDVMSAAPYKKLSPHKIKLAMAIGYNRHYRVKEILPRHFHQTAREAGLNKDDMIEIFSALTERVDSALSRVEVLAVKASAPERTYAPILEGARKRVALIR